MSSLGREVNFLTSNDSNFLNKKAIYDLSDQIIVLAKRIRESVVADTSPVEVVTTTGSLLNCGRLVLDHFGSLMQEFPDEPKFPIGFSRS